MRQILLVGYWILLLTSGCSASRQGGGLHTSEGGVPHVRLSETDAIVVEAVLYRLSETHIVTSELRKKKGTLFLLGLNPDAVNAVVAHLGKESPRIETNREYFRDYTDSRSGKLAWVLQVLDLSETAESAQLIIRDWRGNEDGISFLFKLHRVNGTWRVVSSSIIGVS